MEVIGKEINVLPGITIKYGKGGISTAFHFDNKEEEIDYQRSLEKLKATLYKQYDTIHEIKSEAIHHLTTKTLEGFKNLLLQSFIDHSELTKKITSKQTSYEQTATALSKLERSIIKFLFKRKRIRLEEETSQLRQEISDLEKQIPYSIISLDIDSEDTYHELYKHVIKAFHLLTKSEKRWDVTSSQRTNMIADRTSAANNITRTEIDIKLYALNLIKNIDTPICFHNANGGDLYFYPGFLIVHESNNEFAIIDYTEIEISFRLQRFIEEESVPSDTTIVDQTWYKVNKDGTPDRRFSNNYQIPIVLYGEIHLTSSSGLNEKYSFSNPETAELFAVAFNNYIDALKIAKNLLSEFQ